MLQYGINIIFIALFWQSYAHYKIALFSAFLVAKDTVTMATVGYSKKCPIEKLLIFQRYITYPKMATLE